MLRSEKFRSASSMDFPLIICRTPPISLHYGYAFDDTGDEGGGNSNWGGGGEG